MNPLLARFDCEPSLVAPEFQARFEACLAGVVASDHRDILLGVPRSSGVPLLGVASGADDGFWSDDPTNWRAYLRPYVVREGVLQIPIKGVLLNDFPYALGGYATGYAYIGRALDRGLADGNVKGIALVCDTPGGMVAGNFDLADKIYAARGPKPIRAFAHEMAYSAGYSLASAADRLVVSRSGGVGSVGVVSMHRDVSKALDEAGIKITMIFAGEHKVDGNAFEPLPKAVRDRLQSRVEATWSEFVAIVARNRGMTDEAVRATQALTYQAKDAVAVGFADAIGSLDDAVAEFAASLTPDDDDQEDSMNAITQEQLDAARRDGQEAAAARIGAILGSDHAKDRGTLANHLAFKTDMTVEQAEAALQNSEKAVAPSTSRLDALVPDPTVAPLGGDGGKDAASAGLGAAVDRMVSGMKPAS